MAKNPLLKMTPAAFEKYVHAILRREKMNINDLTVTHLENVKGSDGEYVMDVVVKFTAFGGAKFQCLVECKRYSRPIERDKVMVLYQKLQSTGSHKGMMFSTSRFRSAAIKFAKKYNIALVFVQWGKKHEFVTQGDETPTPTEEEVLMDSWTAELMTELKGHSHPYLARDDVFPGENLKQYFGLSELKGESSGD